MDAFKAGPISARILTLEESGSLCRGTDNKASRAEGSCWLKPQVGLREWLVRAVGVGAAGSSKESGAPEAAALGRAGEEIALFSAPEGERKCQDETKGWTPSLEPC